MKVTSLEAVFIGSFIGTNKKCIKDYSLEKKAGNMNFIFLLLPGLIDSYSFHMVRFKYKTDVHLLFLYFLIIKLVFNCANYFQKIAYN